MIVQKLKASFDSQYMVAEKYYGMLSILNGLKLTQRELQLLAFAAVKGNMSYGNVKDEFCRRYNTTSPTISNIIHKLKTVGLVVKEGGKVKVAPIVALDFSKDIFLEIKLLKANG